MEQQDNIHAHCTPAPPSLTVARAAMSLAGQASTKDSPEHVCGCRLVRAIARDGLSSNRVARDASVVDDVGVVADHNALFLSVDGDDEVAGRVKGDVTTR